MRWFVLYILLPLVVSVPLLIAATVAAMAVAEHDKLAGGAVLGYYLAYHHRLAVYLLNKVQNRLVTWFGWTDHTLNDDSKAN